MSGYEIIGFVILAVLFLVASVVDWIAEEEVENAALWLAAPIIPAGLATANIALDVPVLAWTMSNPLVATGCVVGYFAAGAVWAIFKWRRYSLAWMENIKTDMAAIASRKDQFTHAGYHDAKSLDDKLSKNMLDLAQKRQRMVLFFMIGWPFGVVRFVFQDIVKSVFKFIYRQFDFVFNAAEAKALAAAKAAVAQAKEDVEEQAKAQAAARLKDWERQQTERAEAERTQRAQGKLTVTDIR